MKGDREKRMDTDHEKEKVERRSILFNSIQFNSIQSNSIQFNSILFNAILSCLFLFYFTKIQSPLLYATLSYSNLFNSILPCSILLRYAVISRTSPSTTLYLGVLPNRAKYATALLPGPKKIDPVPLLDNN